MYRELFPAVYGYVRFRVGDAHIAEDVASLIFERALSRLASLRDPDKARAWVFAIARNVITDHRRAGRLPTTDLADAEALGRLWVEGPEADALRREEARRLSRYLSGLGDRERELIGLRFAAGLSNREAARVVGVSEANAAQILHRAVGKLRRKYEEEER